MNRIQNTTIFLHGMTAGVVLLGAILLVRIERDAKKFEGESK